MEARRTLSKIRRYRKSGSVLELGPGGGFFLSEIRNYGYEPYGVDKLNPIEARWIENRLHVPCEKVALSEITFGGKAFRYYVSSRCSKPFIRSAERIPRYESSVKKRTAFLCSKPAISRTFIRNRSNTFTIFLSGSSVFLWREIIGYVAAQNGLQMSSYL